MNSHVSFSSSLFMPQQYILLENETWENVWVVSLATENDGVICLYMQRFLWGFSAPPMQPSAEELAWEIQPVAKRSWHREAAAITKGIWPVRGS